MSDPITTLRGFMHGAAEARPLPDRFTVASGGQSRAILTDSETGRSTTVALGNLAAVRDVLQDLFGDSSVTDQRDTNDRRRRLRQRIASCLNDVADAKRCDTYYGQRQAPHLADALAAFDADDFAVAADLVERDRAFVVADAERLDGVGTGEPWGKNVDMLAADLRAEVVGR